MKLTTSLLIAGALLAGGACAQQASFDEGMILWLDFQRVTDGGFICRATDAACEVEGVPHTQDGAVFISHFTALSVPELAADSATGQLTVAAWIAPNERPRSYQTILYKGKRQGAAVQQIHFFLSLCDGRPEFKFKDETGKWMGIMRNADMFTVPGGTPIPASEVPVVPTAHWSHVAATFDHGHVTLYLNGEEMLSATTATDHLVANEHPLLIGEAQSQAGPRDYVFSGLVDDARIYDRALSGEEVASVYRHERPDKTEDRLSIERPLPEGYDPEFKTKLPLVAAWEQDIPEDRVGDGPTETTIETHRGCTMLHINGQPVYAMAMMPEPYVADDLITLSCRDFAAAGVNLYSEIFWSWATPRDGCHGWWLAPGEYDFEKVDRRIEAIIEANPNALILPRVKLNPPRWWLDAHPDEVCRNADGDPAEQASLASELWEETYERLLRDVIRHMEGSDYAAHIMGYHPAGGRASEWYWWGKRAQVDFSPAAIERYRKWLREQYGGDVAAVRRAWGNPTATFAAAEPPTYEARQVTRHGLFRDPVKDRPVVDYRRFMSDMISRNIVRSCRIVKEETGGSKLAGVFYGYSLHSITQEGFQGLAEVLASPDVDFLASPTDYSHRRGGEVGRFVSTYTASYRLHGKLYWDEVDTRTHLYPRYISYRTDDLPETLSVLRRAVGYSLTKGTSLWWFLLAGNCTFHQAEVMDDIASLRKVCEEALEVDRTPTSEVAIFADEGSMYYTGGDYSTLAALLRGTIDEAARMGAPFDVYLLSDIANPALPDYKLYIFLNAFKLDDDLRQSIEATVRCEGRTAVWVYAPGYVTDSGFSEDSMAALTGLTIRVSDEELPAELTITAQDHAITSTSPASREDAWALSPTFVVDDPQVTVLGTTADRPTLAVREFADWRSVYSMLPLRRELLLGLCRYAGVHVYSETFDPFFANTSYAMVHTSTEGVKRIVLPGEADVTELVTGNEIGAGLSVIEERLPAGVTRIYRMDHR